MASGTITGTGGGYVAKIEWSSTVNSAKTGSSVTATLYVQNVNNCYFYATITSNCTITIDGSNKTGGSGTSLSTAVNGSKKVFDYTKTVSYTGSKSITISATIPNSGISYTSGAIGARSASKSVTLDTVGTIPSAPSSVSPGTKTISETTTSISVSWSKCSSYNGSGGYYVYVSKNGGSYSLAKTITSLDTVSYSYGITAGQGNTYVFRVYSYNNIGTSSSYKQSGTVTTNKLNAPTIGTLGTCDPFVSTNYNVPLSGGSQTDGGGFKRYAKVTIEDSSGATKTWSCTAPSANSNTSVTVPISTATATTYLGSGRYKATITITAWIQNSNGSKSSTVTKTASLNINSNGETTPAAPTITFSGGFGSYTSTCFIKNISSITISASGSSIKNAGSSGATLSYSISTDAGNSKSGSSGTFNCNAAGVFTVTVKATDSRGLSSASTKKYRVQDYSAPTIKILSGERNESSPTNVSMSIQTGYSNIYTYSTNTDTPGTDVNGIDNTSYSLDNGSTWVDVTSNSFTIAGISEDAKKTVKVRVADKIKTTTYIDSSILINTVKKLLSMRKWGVGINCVPQDGNALEVTGQVKINGDFILHNDKYIRWLDNSGASVPVLRLDNTNTLLMNSTARDFKINGKTLNLNGTTVQINGKELHEYKSSSSSADISLTSGTAKSVDSVQVTAGRWLIMGKVRFSENATGYRRISITSTQNSTDANAQVRAVSGATTDVYFANVFAPTGTTTYYLSAVQNSGSAVTVASGKAWMKAIRIG